MYASHKIFQSQYLANQVMRLQKQAKNRIKPRIMVFVRHFIFLFLINLDNL